VPEGSWVDAPHDHIIVGLKELPEDKFAHNHTHVLIVHCYKGQRGWHNVLARFPQGGDTLLDLEFLTDDSGRVAASDITLATLELPSLWSHGRGS
jgi:saccharopine dehydrogenase (NAD+, L-lysine-forming)